MLKKYFYENFDKFYDEILENYCYEILGKLFL